MPHRTRKQDPVAVVDVVVVVVEASAPKVYSRGTLASTSTLSGSVVRTLRGGEGLPKMFRLVASSMGHVRSQCSIVCGSSLQRGRRGSAEGSKRFVGGGCVNVLRMRDLAEA